MSRPTSRDEATKVFSRLVLPRVKLVFRVFGAIAHFERRLIAELTKDGIAPGACQGQAPGAMPIDPDKVGAALKLVQAGLSPTQAAHQVGLGRATVYREMALAGVSRPA